MTISVANNKVSYVGDGSQRIFPFYFRIIDESHLIVTVDDAVTTDYIVRGVNEEDGTIEFNTPPDSGANILLYRLVPIDQLIDYVAYDPFPAETHELGLDKLTMICQQQDEQIGRALKLPPDTPDDELFFNLPVAGNRGFHVLHFDETGTEVRADYEIGNYIGYWSSGSSYAARVTFSDPATEDLYVVLQDHIASNLAADEASGYIHKAMDFATTVQKRDEAVQAAANAAASEAAAAASEAAAASSEANAATSETNSYNWAQADIDVPVDDGVHPSGFSSYHWSKRAEDFINQGGAIVISRTIVNSTGNFVDDLNATDFTGDQYADVTVTTALDVTPNMSVSFVYDGVQYVYQGMKPVLIGLGGATLVAGDFGQNTAVSAAAVSYDPTSSSLVSTNAQDAIDELDAQVETNEADIVVLDVAIAGLTDELGRWDVEAMAAGGTLADYNGATKLYNLTGNGTVVLPADGGVDVGRTFAFVTHNDSTLTFDKATNAQAIVPPFEKQETYRAGSGCIATIVYMGSNTWQLYGDLADV